MRHAHTHAISLAAASAACALIYLFPVPGPRYYPLDHLWRMETIAGEPSMGWYAHMAVALFLGAIVAAIAHRIARRRTAIPAKPMFHLLAASVVATAILAAGVLTWREFGGTH